MRNEPRHTIANFYPSVAGGIFLALGAATLISPQIMGYYSIGLDEADARIATRAMIGGGEIGLGLVLLTGSRIDLSARQRSLVAATIFLCVGISRLIGVWIEWAGLSIAQSIRKATIEIMLGAMGLLVAHRSKPKANDNGGTNC